MLVEDTVLVISNGILSFVSASNSYRFKKLLSVNFFAPFTLLILFLPILFFLYINKYTILQRKGISIRKNFINRLFYYLKRQATPYWISKVLLPFYGSWLNNLIAGWRNVLCYINLLFLKHHHSLKAMGIFYLWYTSQVAYDPHLCKNVCTDLDLLYNMEGRYKQKLVYES